MTPNIASPLFNTLAFAFFAIVIVSVALAAYAATFLKKTQNGGPKSD